MKAPHHGSADFDFSALKHMGPVVSLISSGDEHAGKEHIHPRTTLVMLGKVRYEGMRMQLCPSASGAKEMTGFTARHKGSSLKYRKIQELEMDPLFLKYIQHSLFRHITRKKIGEKVGVFRSMFFNKPAEGGVPLVWHQDGHSWNLSIPEEITIYTALDPQTRENGCLTVIPYSHKECPIHTIDREDEVCSGRKTGLHGNG